MPLFVLFTVVCSLCVGVSFAGASSSGNSVDSDSESVLPSRSTLSFTFDVRKFCLSTLPEFLARYGWFLLIGGIVTYIVYRQLSDYIRKNHIFDSAQVQRANEEMRRRRYAQQEEWEKNAKSVYEAEQAKKKEKEFQKLFASTANANKKKIDADDWKKLEGMMNDLDGGGQSGANTSARPRGAMRYAEGGSACAPGGSA